MNRSSNGVFVCILVVCLGSWGGCSTAPIVVAPPQPVAESPFQQLAQRDLSSDLLYYTIADRADAEGFARQLEQQSDLVKSFTPADMRLVRESFLRSLKVMLFDLAPPQFWQRHLTHYYAARLSSSDAQMLVETYERDVREPRSRLEDLRRQFVEQRVSELLPAVRARSFRIEISSDAMLPTLLPGDHVLLHKAAYHTAEPERSDVVVYRYPDEDGTRFLHRVVGVPGDRVEVRDQVILVNGQQFPETSVQHTDRISMAGNVRDNLGPVIVPADSYFLIGDNREQSVDSRFLGPISKEHILGKAIAIYWSVDPKTRVPRWERLNQPVR